MKVFLTGASGVLGRSLVRALVRRGHTAVGLVRDARGAELVRAAGGEPVEADIFHAGKLARVATGCEVVIHGATSIPMARRTRRRAWAMNDTLRREGTLALTWCAAEIKAKAYIQQSIVWTARPKNGEPFDETSIAPLNWVYQSAWDAEQIAKDASQRFGFTTAILRCGMFYGPESSHTRAMAQGLKARGLPVVGKGEARWSMLHHDDAGEAFAAVASAPKSGTWHVVDDEPVSVQRYLSRFSELLGAPAPRHRPGFLMRPFVDKAVYDLFTISTVTGAQPFKAAFDWRPRLPTYEEGLRHVVEAWRSAPPVKRAAAESRP